MALLRFATLFVVLLGLLANTIAAQEIAPVPAKPSQFISEVRFGVSAYNVHYNMLPYKVWEFRLDDITDINFDVLFTSPDIDAFRWIGSPRPELGISANTAGEASLIHLGLTWQLHLGESPIFVEGTLGAAAHSGFLSNAPPGEKNFGCRVNFYERFGIGTDLGKNATAVLAYEHTSNADLCNQNEGLSNLGLRIGWRF